MDVEHSLAVSVIIPVFGGRAPFAQCLDSLARCVPAMHEAIVVVDGPDAVSTQTAAAAGCRVLPLPQRCGPAAARNAGAQAASGAILLFLDADVLAPADLIGRLQALFAGDPGLSAVFGSYDDAPAGRNFLSQYRNLLHHYIHQTANPEAVTFWAGCGAIRREVFLACGGFDPRFSRPAIEDIELGYRLRRMGARIRLCKTLQVKHLKIWGPYSLLRADICDRAWPWSRLIVQEGGLINDLNLQWASRWSGVLVLGLAICPLLTGVCSQFGVPWWWALIVAAAAVLGLLALNAPVYRFFWCKRGPLFTLMVLPWHWLYYLYSSLVFGLVLILHHTRIWRAEPNAGPGSGLTLPKAP